MVRISLRRYTSRYGKNKCPGSPVGYHVAKTSIFDVPRGGGHRRLEDYLGDDRWPQKCGHCDYDFGHNDMKQLYAAPLYTRVEDGTILELDQAKPGDMWDATWHHMKGHDDKSIVVVCPGGTSWFVDGKADWCPIPWDTNHRCWLRVGTPPEITVCKMAPNQKSCGSGDGRVITKEYEGFLTEGKFTKNLRKS